MASSTVRVAVEVVAVVIASSLTYAFLGWSWTEALVLALVMGITFGVTSVWVR